jgi:hypothetical protein
MPTNMQTHGFLGSLAWVHAQEGSGAKYYGTSVYYPDDRKNPRTNSGVTIDPGLDLGNAAESLIQRVLEYYNSVGLLTVKQFQLLIQAVGLKKFDAIEWMRKHENEFMGAKEFAVPEGKALKVLDDYTAAEYWDPLCRALPKLKKINVLYMAEAVHTALLSMAYNRGATKTAELARKHLDICNYGGLAYEIKFLKQSTQSLRDRRHREAELIIDAIELKKDFKALNSPLSSEGEGAGVRSLNIMPMPLMTSPEVRQQFFEMNLVEVPPKPEIVL